MSPLRTFEQIKEDPAAEYSAYLMEMASAWSLNSFCVTCILCWESTSWFPSESPVMPDFDVLLFSQNKQNFEQTVECPLKGDSILLVTKDQLSCH